MNLGLKGKKALVTGGTHGIGLAIAEALREEEVDVIVVSRRNGYDLVEVENIQKVLIEYPDIDILVNNVGGGGRWKMTEWYKVWEKNVMPATLLTLGYLDQMCQKKWGRVITIASIFGKESGGTFGFTMAKASEIALMKSLAICPNEGCNVTFNTVSPGAIRIAGKENEGFVEYGEPEDVAGIVTFLCSDKAKWISGANIVVDHGYSRSF
jgi:3-oxoacyl-[acyl-carrier protein] reductase